MPKKKKIIKNDDDKCPIKSKEAELIEYLSNKIDPDYAGIISAFPIAIISTVFIDKKILPTLLSRCINFKITLTNKESLDIANNLLNGRLSEAINKDLINYYLTPGNIYNLAKFAEKNKYKLIDLDLKNLLKLIIKENHYKKDLLIRDFVFDLVEFYFRKINFNFSSNIYKKYSYFLKRISDTKRFNLDQESLFIELEEEILNG